MIILQFLAISNRYRQWELAGCTYRHLGPRELIRDGNSGRRLGQLDFGNGANESAIEMDYKGVLGKKIPESSSKKMDTNSLGSMNVNGISIEYKKRTLIYRQET